MEYEVKLKDEFIRLGQALKAAHLCMSGGEAKEMIAEGRVRVNDEVEVRRGRKLHDGDRVESAGGSFTVHADSQPR